MIWAWGWCLNHPQDFGSGHQRVCWVCLAAMSVQSVWIDKLRCGCSTPSLSLFFPTVGREDALVNFNSFQIVEGVPSVPADQPSELYIAGDQSLKRLTSVVLTIVQVKQLIVFCAGALKSDATPKA